MSWFESMIRRAAQEDGCEVPANMAAVTAEFQRRFTIDGSQAKDPRIQKFHDDTAVAEIKRILQQYRAKSVQPKREDVH